MKELTQAFGSVQLDAALRLLQRISNSEVACHFVLSMHVSATPPNFATSSPHLTVQSPCFLETWVASVDSMVWHREYAFFFTMSKSHLCRLQSCGREQIT